MKPSQIKTECELIYTQKKSLDDRLTRLRSICKHSNTIGKWKFLFGIWSRAETCSVCGNVKVLPPEWEILSDINGKDI